MRKLPYLGSWVQAQGRSETRVLPEYVVDFDLDICPSPQLFAVSGTALSLGSSLAVCAMFGAVLRRPASIPSRRNRLATHTARPRGHLAAVIPISASGPNVDPTDFRVEISRGREAAWRNR